MVEQPAPVERPSAKPSQRWAVQAEVQRRGTGNAKGSWINERSPKMYAPSMEAAVLKQQEFINDYLHPKVCRSMLEWVSADARPSLDRFPSGFRMCRRVLIARDERHAKTRSDCVVLSAIAIRFSINAGERIEARTIGGPFSAVLWAFLARFWPASRASRRALRAP